MAPAFISSIQSPLRQRAAAAGAHLAISALLAVCAGVLVFTLWYPGSYRTLAGGLQLFLLVVGIDVVLGPLLTFLVFDLRKKGWPHLRRDLLVIGAIQLSALAYGLHVVHAARPVALVFEVDRFRVITANNVHEPELAQALPAYRHLPLTGPWLLAARLPADADEAQTVLTMGLDGIDVGQRPRFWQPYADGKSRALARSKPVESLYQRFPSRQGELDDALARASLDRKTARYLPLMSRVEWVVLLDHTGEVRGFAPVDGFS